MDDSMRQETTPDEGIHLDEDVSPISSPYRDPKSTIGRVRSKEEVECIIMQRNILANLEQTAYAQLPEPNFDIEEFWANIPLRDGWLSRVLVVRPRPVTVESYDKDAQRWTHKRSPTSGKPLMIYFHGGGYAAGSPIQLAFAARIFAQELNVTCLLPSYRLAPEHSWPQCMMDGLDILQQVSSTKMFQFGAHPDRDGLVLAGCSAGGSIASVVAGLTSASPSNFPLKIQLTGLFLSTPLVFRENIIPLRYKDLWVSMEENENTSPMEGIAVDAVLDATTSDDFRSPWYSAVNIVESPDYNTKTTLSRRHPPTYIEAGALDRLRGDAIVYHRLLQDAHVSVRLRVYPDDGHVSLSTLSVLAPSKSQNPSMLEGTLEGIRWLLSGQMHSESKPN